MKKLLVCVIFFAAGIFIAAHADTLTLINHYGNSLKFSISQGQQYEVGLADQFTLNNNIPAVATQIYPAVSPENLDACEPFNSPILLYFYDPNSNQKQPNDGYFGVGRECGSSSKFIDVRPYVGRDINYSVSGDGQQSIVITFCTPAEYQANGGICP